MQGMEDDAYANWQLYALSEQMHATLLWQRTANSKALF